MALQKRINRRLKKFIKNSLFTNEEFKRFKKTETFKRLREYRYDRFIAKDIKRDEYASLKKKRMHYIMDKKGWLSDEKKEIILNKIFKAQLGYDINFRNPQTFNEKIMWMKLYYQNPLIVKCCDKFALKDYVSNVLGEEYVIPVIDSWTNADQIDFDKLPDQFAIKVNWASFYLKIVKDKSSENLEQLRKQIKKWMQPYRNGYYQTFNWGYKDMPAMVFAEEYMEQIDGQLFDYKFFCFDGKVEYMFVATERFNKEMVTSHDFYDKDFNSLDFTYGGRSHVKEKIKKPKNFEKMKVFAEKLSKPFPFTRVDFYEVGDKIYVGEMTFYPGAAIQPFEPREWDYIFGEKLNLPTKLQQNREQYYEKLTPRESFLLEDKITIKEQKQYCIQKGYAQMGYYPNLKNPVSFNEKIIYLALYYKNPNIAIAANKVTAKDYIAERIGKEYVVPMIGAYDDLDEINFEQLPNKFVCKANDGWGANEVIVVDNKDTCCFDYLKTIMSNWLYPWSSYYYQNLCITDEKIETKVLIEEFIESDSEVGLTDFKFYCCNGKPKFALVVSGRNKSETRTFVDMDWNPIPVARKGKRTSGNPMKPNNLSKMIDLAEKLAEGFPLVRIDFYEANNKVYVGEMTFTPGMFLGLRPIEMDYKLGELLDLSELNI